MTPLQPRLYAKCTSVRLLRNACPHLVPATSDEVGRRSFVHAPTGRKVRYRAFGVEWGAPYRNRLNRDDRPPRFSHVEVHGGDLTSAFPFGWPGESATPAGQPKPHDLGRREWDGRSGRLVLAPRYPFGGPHGAHLIFRWRQDARDYAISMHAWLPLDQAEKTIRRIVTSIDLTR